MIWSLADLLAAAKVSGLGRGSVRGKSGKVSSGGRVMPVVGLIMVSMCSGMMYLYPYREDIYINIAQ